MKVRSLTPTRNSPTVTAVLEIKKMAMQETKKELDWNFRAPPEKWQAFREEIQKSVNCATDTMSNWKIPMTERYVKWEKLIYKAAMKTIGRTTYKATGPKKTI